jgi:hypothetical protein
MNRIVNASMSNPIDAVAPCGQSGLCEQMLVTQVAAGSCGSQRHITRRVSRRYSDRRRNWKGPCYRSLVPLGSAVAVPLRDG